MSHRLHAERQRTGLTQAEVAARSGVSRQLIGAIENGRHLPRVDAAIAIAAALDVPVSRLFGETRPVVDALSGHDAAHGVPLRTGTVGDQIVSTEVSSSASDWEAADGVIVNGEFSTFGPGRPGLVIAGCEPGLAVLERILRERGASALSIATSTKSAVEALAAGRVHASVVHGRDADRIAIPEGLEIIRYRLVSWQVGLAAPIGSDDQWWLPALAGEIPVVQREAGAGVQRAFVEVAGSAPGPIVASHVEAASHATMSGLPAVTIEPAARAAGAVFHPIETHEAQLWVARKWAGAPVFAEAMDVVLGQRFRMKLESVGGYDLSSIGDVA
jgi:transcriptional regulator with XRE-family HTH domain